MDSSIIRHRYRTRSALLLVGVTVVALLAGTAGAFAAHQFSDVDDGHGFHDQIGWMAETGISEGYPNGTYRPTNAVTRQAMSAFMQRLAGHDPEVEPMVDAATLQGMTATDLEGVSGLEYAFDEVTVTDSLIVAFAPCSPGKVPVGGGGMLDTTGWFLGVSSAWYDEETDTLGWLIVGESADGVVDEVYAAAVATCAEPDTAVDEGELDAQSSTSGAGEVRELQQRYARSRVGER